jgi:hypothetical protein
VTDPHSIPNWDSQVVLAHSTETRNWYSTMNKIFYIPDTTIGKKTQNLAFNQSRLPNHKKTTEQSINKETAACENQ